MVAGVSLSANAGEGLKFHGTGSRPVAVLGMCSPVPHTCSGIEMPS